MYDSYGNKLPISACDFGGQFAIALQECSKERESNIDFGDAIKNLKVRCQDFLCNLIEEVEKRLPSNKEIFRGLALLHPTKVLSQTARAQFHQLPLPHLISNKTVVEEQYRKIMLHMWAEEVVFDGEIPEDSVLFWSKIRKHEDALGGKPYKELAQYALACLSCPVSNAVVERIFSQVTVVKNKNRNQMSLKMLNAIVRIRTTLHMNGQCCDKLAVTNDMLSRFQSDMYVPFEKEHANPEDPVGSCSIVAL